MKVRVAKCCLFVNLRLACFMIAIFDTCVHIVNLQMCNHPVFDILATFVYITHALGCFMLVLSVIIEMSHLVIVYLITNIMQALVLTVSSYYWVTCQENSKFDISVAIFSICISIYFWIVAYSYLRLCKERVSDEYFASFSKSFLR
ncbi:uncharacterized protein LOC117793496 [Drosophila innubila]|uniref:uncharacterized protein LOC117793496 n=1 Tax=Drosophila innubila TaxID=198719 RepID=UPI00148C44FE|nr:uncharacterized protein LOC117793496 [Drosophila innubila]